MGGPIDKAKEKLGDERESSGKQESSGTLSGDDDSMSSPQEEQQADDAPNTKRAMEEVD
jgi:hypothetical protein